MAMKLRNKLLLLNVSVIGATALFMVGLIYLLVSYQMRKEMWGFLSDEFREYALKYEAMLDDIASVDREMQEHFTRARMAYPIVCRIYDDSGQLIASAENAPKSPVTDTAVVIRALKGEEFNYALRSEDTNSKDTYWCSIRRVLSPGGRVFAFEVGLKIDRINRRIERLRNYLLISVPAILLISTASAWLIVRRSLHPFVALLANLQKIRSSSLERRLPVHNTKDEVDELAKAVNTMLVDVHNAFSLTKEFTSDAAHELRTPLARLSVMLERCVARPLLLEEARSTLDDAYQECMCLRRLIDDLMLLARLDVGEVEGEPAVIDLADIIDDMEELWSTACQERDIVLKVSADHPLPIYGHSMLLRRLLTNLVDNALRHTSRGDLIQIVAKHSGKNIEIKITDTGTGIARDEIPKLFNRFYRIDSNRTSDTGGTGLGLSICLKIAELYNGDIGVDSTEGGGSTFSVTLPEADEELPERQEEDSYV